jgi:hypothetical protein
MKSKATLWLLLLTLAALIGLFAGQASAVLYTFDSNPPPDWGNEQGNWIAFGGSYYAQQNYADPNGYTSLPFNLTDFVFEVDVSNLHESGLWLRSNYNGGKFNGILFVESRWGDTYFHIIRDGIWTSPVDIHYGRNINGTHLKAVVNGDNYAVYADGNLINTLVNDEFPSGRVALFRNYMGSSFDNANLVPIPGTMLLLGSGLLGLVGWRKLRKS